MSTGWVPVAKGFTKYLPVDRRYTELEAVFSLQVDYNNGNTVTVMGYAKLWRWSPKKVRDFINKLGAEIAYQKDTREVQNQRGQIRAQKRDRMTEEKEQIIFIDFKELKAVGDRKRAGVGQKRDRKGFTTTNKNKNKSFYSLDSDEFRLAELLYDLILARSPSFKKPDLQKWAQHIDLMIRLDDRTPEKIEEVIRWLQGDNFWQDVILSTQKLREQFDQLALKARKSQTQPTSIGTDVGVCRNCGKKANFIKSGLCDACSGNSFK